METARDTHSISLKVLRLSRPSLAQQFPLDVANPSNPYHIDAPTALDAKDPAFDKEFMLSPVLTLPPAFGPVYVGETFSCTLCANNELSAGADRRAAAVKVTGEMLTPSGDIKLDLIPSDDASETHDIAPGGSLQRLVRFDLREEGDHTLAVNVSYMETTTAKDHTASSGRPRTFRKLYQFLARPCLNVRTKISSLTSEPRAENRGWILEAQLDNVSDGAVTLRTVTFAPKSPFETSSLNVDSQETFILSPRDVMQVAFLVYPSPEESALEATRDSRVSLGQLSIQWRTAMGDTGHLSTGWLTTKQK